MTNFVNLHMLGLGLCLVGITQLSISIMHAHLKKICLMFMPNEVITNFVNAHAQVYVQWASSFSISIMHARLKKIKISYVYAKQASICQKYIYAQACQVSHMVFLVHTLPAGYF